MSNAALKIDLNEDPCHKTVVVEKKGDNKNPSSTRTYTFYPLSDFEKGSFFRGLLFKNNPKSYFSAFRCYSWVATSLFTPLAILFIWPFFDKTIQKLHPIILFAGGFFLFLAFLGFVIMAIEAIEYIFWPKESVGKAMSNCDGFLDYYYFSKEETEDETTKHRSIKCDCLHPTDWSQYRITMPTEFKSPIMKVIGGIFTAILWMIGIGFTWAAFGWVVSLPLNTILLVVIIYLLASRK